MTYEDLFSQLSVENNSKGSLFADSHDQNKEPSKACEIYKEEQGDNSKDIIDEESAMLHNVSAGSQQNTDKNSRSGKK